MSAELVRALISAAKAQDTVPLEDAALVGGDRRLAFTTDAFVVSPLFFPGGDIGRLAVCGTVNDLGMKGAQPLALSLAFIIEEGFSQGELAKITASAGEACREAGMPLVAGDTKVVERGAADGLFITSAGIGVVPDGCDLSPSRVAPGDKVIASGTLGDHGVAILAARQRLGFATEVQSDCAPLNGLVAALVEAGGPDVHCLRDPTRGGPAAILNEIARQAEVEMVLHEPSLPIQPAVRSACELLGMEPLQMASEGRLMGLVSGDAADRVLNALRGHRLGEKAEVIGEVRGKADGGKVVVGTAWGTERVLDMPSGELLPRIC